MNFSDRYPLDPPEVSPLVYTSLSCMLHKSNGKAYHVYHLSVGKGRSSFLLLPDDSDMVQAGGLLAAFPSTPTHLQQRAHMLGHTV